MLGIIIVHAATNFLALFAQVLFPQVAASIVTASLTFVEVVVTLLFGVGVPLLTAYIIIRKASK